LGALSLDFLDLLDRRRDRDRRDEDDFEELLDVLVLPELLSSPPSLLADEREEELLLVLRDDPSFDGSRERFLGGPPGKAGTNFRSNVVSPAVGHS
jgi:hypothetical protein